MKKVIECCKSHKIIGLTALLLASYFFGYILLVLAYCFPVEAISNNIRKNYLSCVSVSAWIPGREDSEPDVFSDSVMLLEAEYPVDDSPFMVSIRSPRALLPDVTYVYETYLAYNESNDYVFYEYDYFRYWHGYLILLKPLLAFFSLGTVKGLMFLVQFILVNLFIYLVIKNNLSFKCALPMLLAYLFMNPVTLALSFQFNPVIVITLVSVILLLFDYMKNRAINTFSWVFFFMIGVSTSYFDLLSFPLVSFGLPFVYYFMLYGQEQKSEFLKLFKLLLCWGSGYGLMWLGKWIASFFVFGKDAVDDIIRSISIRSGFDVSESFSGDYMSYSAILIRNISVRKNVIILFCAVLLVLFLWIILKKKNGGHLFGVKDLVLLIISVLPCAWYFMMPNHSWIHYWFTFRNLSVSICALTMMVITKYDIRIKDNESI